MLSCYLIPDFNPGADVLQIDLRLTNPTSFGLNSCTGIEERTSREPTLSGCKSTKPLPTIPILLKFYKLILPPLTRWDAARFLKLAIDPSLRKPRDPSDCQNESNLQERNECLFNESEQAHAFFPALPTLIRALVVVLLAVLPRILLPPTLEGVAVLAAGILNFYAFCFAAVALHSLTYTLAYENLRGSSLAKQRDDADPNMTQRISVQVAEMSTLIFCFNPASVFFTTCYSESLFACLTFGSYALVAGGEGVEYALSKDLTASASLVLVLAACCTRSNGTLISIWITLTSLSSILSKVNSRGDKIYSAFEMVVVVISIFSVAFWRETVGIKNHCRNGEAEPWEVPDWCHEALKGFFSLYSFVQRKHWNVGFLRYYQWKQLPNFLLAFPILFYSVCAVATWISQSWERFVYHQRPTRGQNNTSLTPTRLVQWAICSLRLSCDWNNPHIPKQRIPPGRNAIELALVGPTMLAHYAMLAAIALLGATIAHVQISTRMICSSCPALYWYLASICLRDSDPFTTPTGTWLVSQHGVFVYCLSYILLGVILHPNWLPWT